MTATAATATRGRFAWHELLTTDPAAAQAFYKQVIGWGTRASDAGMPDYTMWTAGQTPVGGVMRLPEQAVAMGAPPHWLAYVEVPDADATVAQALQLGGKVHKEATTIEHVGRFAVLMDPEGASFGIISNATRQPAETDPAPLEFSWHELTTPNLPGAISFYEQLFGWEKKGEFDMGPMGTYHMYGRDRFTYGGMMKKAENMPAPPGAYWLHYIYVRDTADAAAERATKAGATIMVPPMEVPGGDRVSVMSDPQGVVFAVHSKSAK